MKNTMFVLAALLVVTGFGLKAADAPGWAIWTLADTKAAEAKFAADKKDPTANPVITQMELPSGDNVRRTSFGKSGEAEMHENNTDVFTILSGEGDFVLGGKIVGAKVTNPGETRGTSIQGGVTRKVSVGDIIIVPPRIPHIILVPKGQRMTFSVVKAYK